MSRARWALFVLAAGLLAQQKQPGKQEPAPEQQEPAPAEEDEMLKPKEYAFNPIQAANELRTGNYYFRKKSYRAAVLRFREATKWNPQSAEAFLRLGEAAEKQKDSQAAREAYQKYLDLSPDAKNRAEITKKVTQLSKH